MISFTHNLTTQRHELSLYLKRPGWVWYSPLFNGLYLPCKVTAARLWPGPPSHLEVFIQGSVSPGSDLQGRTWSKCRAVLLWDSGLELPRLAPPWGAAVPRAVVGTAGKWQRAASFHLGLREPGDTDSLLLSGNCPLKWQETSICLSSLLRELKKIFLKSQTTWVAVTPLLDLLFIL